MGSNVKNIIKIITHLVLFAVCVCVIFMITTRIIPAETDENGIVKMLSPIVLFIKATDVFGIIYILLLLYKIIKRKEFFYLLNLCAIIIFLIYLNIGLV